MSVTQVELAAGISGDLLARAAHDARLPAQVASPGPPAGDELEAYIIEGHQRPLDPAVPDQQFLDLAIRQLGRELVAHTVRYLRTHGFTGPASGDLDARIEATGQPPAHNDFDSIGWRVVGKRGALLIGLHGPVIVETSTETTARLDDGQAFNAFAAGGAVHRLTAGLRIELVGDRLVAAQPPDAG